MARLAERINIELRKHQTETDDWQYKLAVDDLHVWADRFIFEFKLQTTTPAIMFESLRKNIHGQHRSGRNGLGLRHEIAISKTHLKIDGYWQVLGTELHELLHAEQEDVGRPGRRNYHNKHFRERAREFGLIVDRYGHTQYAQGDTPFLRLLRKYGVQVPEIPEPDLPSPQQSRSSLVLYECICGVKVRVGRSRFNARCLDCGSLFERKG